MEWLVFFHARRRAIWNSVAEDLSWIAAHDTIRNFLLRRRLGRRECTLRYHLIVQMTKHGSAIAGCRSEYSQHTPSSVHIPFRKTPKSISKPQEHLFPDSNGQEYTDTASSQYNTTTSQAYQTHPRRILPAISQSLKENLSGV